MKNVKKTSAVLSLILAVVMAAGAASVLSFASGDKSEKNPQPACIFDFTDPLGYDLGGSVNCDADPQPDGLLFTVTADDPNCVIGYAQVPASNMLYASIGYKAEFAGAGRYAEIYYTTLEGAGFDEATKLTWNWEDASGNWTTQVVEMKSFAKEKGTVYQVRLDPVALSWGNHLVAGEWIKVSYIAFFPTREEAEAFDVGAYRKAIGVDKDTATHEILPGDFGQPEPAELVTCAEDNVPGTLTLTPSDDGSTVTVSYVLNGETVSYTVPNNPTYTQGGFGGTDDLGRTVYTQYTEIDPDYTKLSALGKVTVVDEDARRVGVIGDNGEHYIGLFYFLWLGEHGDSGPQDIQKILDKYGKDANNPNLPEWSSKRGIYFFAEPLYGYYYSNDSWVMRKHVELLTNAGVDFLYFDTTNNACYSYNARMLMSILHEFNTQGYDAPQVVFYTNTDADARVKQIYNAIYEPGLYPDTWFIYDGKPLIIAPDSANIKGFFTIRNPQWPNEKKKDNAWPWIDWNWPQKTYNYSRDGVKVRAEAINVSVAQHAGNSEFSSSQLYGYVGNWGRSFDGTYDNLTDDSYKLGLNLQKQFNVAIASGAKVVMVTGWNEWIAGRQDPASGREIRFIDTFSYEYSRDMEMSRGGYFDNYYMQLVSNIAAVKGAAPALARDGRTSINVTGDFSQWDSVPLYYTDPSGDTVARDGHGFGGVKYQNDTGRNDFTVLKVTGDTTNLYFYAECADTVERPEGASSWMQVYLDTDGEPTGFYGYDYVLNYSPKSDTVTTVAKYTGSDNAFSFTDCGEIRYRVYANKIMMEIPLELIGVTEYDRINVQFKWVDSRTVMDTMEDMYIDGDTAPLGRLNYVYQTYIPGLTEGPGHAVISAADKAAGAGEDIATEPASAADTVADTDPEPVTEPVTQSVADTDGPADETAPAVSEADGTTAADGSAQTDAEDGSDGCRSLAGTAGVWLTLTLLPATGALCLRRKKE